MPKDTRVCDHLRVPAGIRWGYANLVVSPIPGEPVGRLGIAEAVIRASVGVPHPVPLAVFDDVGPRDRVLLVRRVIDADDPGKSGRSPADLYIVETTERVVVPSGPASGSVLDVLVESARGAS
jgi:hypothetical protein